MRSGDASDGAFAVGMLAEYEASLRRYGPWFYRRLHWEAGAIGQMLYLEAEAAGLRATGIGCFFDDSMHQVLGLPGYRTAGQPSLRYQTVYHFTVGGPVEDAPPADAASVRASGAVIGEQRSEASHASRFPQLATCNSQPATHFIQE
ncbi:MAG: nitroreductase family protein [Anaerolineae bacterium]|nr:nitroreductase family protein [Anaerolineae bacterium]